jgi:predicted thioesterase
MTRAAMKPLVAVLALVLTLALAAGAGASIVTSTDLQGRRITFDVRATAVDTNWYTDVLRATAHGDEISNVTIRIVPDQSIEGLCGSEAAACYTGAGGRPTIFIPAGKNQFIEGTLIHEYGHHVDASTSVPGIPELNGIPAWWADRGMAAMFASRKVAFDYSMGWDHSIAEIFAEDYAYIHVGSSYHYGITWLTPPDDKLKADMFAELGGVPTATLPAAPNTPLVVHRVGTLTPHDVKSVPFGLLGPGRRVTFTATVSGAARKGVRARIQVVCNGQVAGARTIGKGQKARTLDLPNMGPGDCDARLVSAAPVSLKYTLRLQLKSPEQATSSLIAR